LQSDDLDSVIATLTNSIHVLYGTMESYPLHLKWVAWLRFLRLSRGLTSVFRSRYCRFQNR